MARELLTCFQLCSSGGESGKSSEEVQNPGGGGGKNWLSMYPLLKTSKFSLPVDNESAILIFK